MGAGKRSSDRDSRGTGLRGHRPGLARAPRSQAPRRPRPRRPHRPPSVTLPPNKDLEAVRKKLEKLYHDAAVATDAYNAAEEQAEKQSAEIVELAREIVEGQERLAELKDRAGAAARAQYRSRRPAAGRRGCGSVTIRGLWLDGVSRIRQGEKATKGLLAELTRTQQDLEMYAQDASAQWKKLEASRQGQGHRPEADQAADRGGREPRVPARRRRRRNASRSWSGRPPPRRRPPGSAPASSTTATAARRRRARRPWSSRRPRWASRTSGAPRAPARSTARA